MQSSKKTLSLDFDGVCHAYTSKWVDEVTILDGPVPGLFNFLMKADKDFVIEIYSTRSATAGGRLSMAAWFQRQARDYASQTALPDFLYTQLIGVIDRLRFPSHKPKAFVGLDDRILTFEGQWPSPEMLLGWEPWNKRKTRKVRLPIEFDAASFESLKALLYGSIYRSGKTDEMSSSWRLETDALKRLHDQIRDMEFPNV